MREYDFLRKGGVRGFCDWHLTKLSSNSIDIRVLVRCDGGMGGYGAVRVIYYDWGAAV